MEKTLYVIAGPTGTGKSTFGPVLVGGNIKFFNGDIVFNNYLENNPGATKSDALRHANEAFVDTVQQSKDQNKSLAYETNFSDYNAMSTPRYCKAFKYYTHLIYFSVESLKESETRVAKRFKDKTGHNVDASIIKSNFDKGPENLQKYFKEFDKVTLFDNKITKTHRFPRKVMEFENGILKFKSSHIPAYFEKQFPELYKLTKINEKKSDKGMSM